MIAWKCTIWVGLSALLLVAQPRAATTRSGLLPSRLFEFAGNLYYVGILPEGMLFIDGNLRRAEGRRTYDNIGPWTGKPVGVAADASAADVEMALSREEYLETKVVAWR